MDNDPSRMTVRSITKRTVRQLMHTYGTCFGRMPDGDFSLEDIIAELERRTSLPPPPPPDAEAVRLAERAEVFIKELRRCEFGEVRLDATVDLLSEAAATIRRLADARDSWQKRALEAELELAEVSSELASLKNE